MPNLYIIAGCNGAGKTTASYSILPEILNCREFVNADNIAAGLSPFNPASVVFEAGRIMLTRIRKHIEEKVDFAFETTLATRSYVSLIKEAKAAGYHVTLVYFWLDSPEQAIKRVAKRVSDGGRHIPDEAIDNITTIPSNASFSAKVLFGVKKALRKLAEETAAKEGSLVVKIDGEIKEVPAKELLKTLPKQ